MWEVDPETKSKVLFYSDPVEDPPSTTSPATLNPLSSPYFYDLASISPPLAQKLTYETSHTFSSLRSKNGPATANVATAPRHPRNGHPPNSAPSSVSPARAYTEVLACIFRS